mgnify:CR=1 FL=1
MFFYIKCVLFVLVLSISGEISAQEKRDSVRIYFHQGKVNIDTCLLDNGNEMERFAKICSALNDSVRLIRKIQIIGGASPEGGGLLNGRLSEKRAEVLWRYISPYIKIPVLEMDFLHRQIICLSITYQTSKSNISQISNFQLHFLIKLFLI